MKKIITIIIVLAAGFSGYSQLANIPTGPFKTRLLNSTVANHRAKDLNGNWLAIDANADGQLQVSEVQNVSYLNLNTVGTGIFNIEGINELTNLVEFYMQDATLFDINLHGLQHLETFNVIYSSMNYIYLSDLPALKKLLLWYNHLESLDVHELTNLELLDCHNNYITSLDVSNLTHLTTLKLGGNRMTYINMKNGSAENLGTDGISQSDNMGNPCLKFICADENQIANVQFWIDQMGTSGELVVVNTYCNFVPGGIYYTVSGNNRMDINSNGCDASDVIIPYLKLQVNDGLTTDYIYSNGNGYYSVPVVAGTYTITPVLENLPGYSISPASINVGFPATASPVTQDLCITPTTPIKDLEVLIIPTSLAVPGFDSFYEIAFRNKGTERLSGTINFTFDSSKMDLNYAIPTATIASNTLSWNFTDLNPFETRSIGVEFAIHTPMDTPPVDNGDILSYTATINPTTADATPNDNTFTLNDIVFNSHDPNDKRCLEGSVVSPNVIGDYVHYVIRFENTGTANARNIVVKDVIDTTKFDISSLVPLRGSNPFVTRISHGNRVEFIFENINLPFDDAHNDGYITFKIKTKPTLVVGDTFSNSADIYFDYNFPVITNTATSTIQLLNAQDLELGNLFTLSPVPANDLLHIASKGNQVISSVSIYNTLGQLVQASRNPGGSVDVSSLSAGNYIAKILFDQGKTAAVRFIKK